MPAGMMTSDSNSGELYITSAAKIVPASGARKMAPMPAPIPAAIARQIAGDAMVSESVLMTNYVKETDEEMRQRSNRTYRRIQASLSPEVASRYGHVQDARSEMESQLRAAIDKKNWAHVIEVAQQLQHQALPQTAD